MNIEYFRIQFYNFVDSSCQYSCSNIESLFSSSFNVGLSSFSGFFSLSVTADLLIKTELTEIKCASKIFGHLLKYTKIHTRLDRRGEVEGGGADHADDDGVVEEDHGDGVSDPRLSSEPGPKLLWGLSDLPPTRTESECCDNSALME